ncbi:MAG: PhoH family protein [Mucinivorans sp.]
MNEKTLTFDRHSLYELFGAANANIDYINSKFPVLKIVVRGGQIHLVGSDEQMARYESCMGALVEYVDRYGHISNTVIDQIFDSAPQLSIVAQPQSACKSVSKADGGCQSIENLILFGTNGSPIRAQTPAQKKLVEAYEKNDMLFAIGPAGSGKTYTAIALAVRALKNKEVKKIILTRPAVEAGEKLGFLPGDMKDKLDPYLQPLYDALGDMMPRAKLNEYMDEGVVQIAPLAYMRGRTLDSAVVILDEAQNTSNEQLKMFLTRMGRSAKFIITGDLTQIDLPLSVASGLSYAIDRLDKVSGISIVKFSSRDILRHPLVGKIVAAYEKG